MPWSKHKNNWHPSQWECDMEDAHAEAELAAARSGRHRPAPVEVVIEEKDFFGNRTVTRRTSRHGTTTTTTVEVARPRRRTQEEAAVDLVLSAFDLFV